MRTLTSACLIILVALYSTTAFSAGSHIAESFSKALTLKDEHMMHKLVKENISVIPKEVNALIKDALSKDKTKSEREALYIVAETMASKYSHLSNDSKPLKEAKTSHHNQTTR